MSKLNEKYPVISEKEYWARTSKNEPYKGFVEYPNGILSFVLSEVVVETKSLSFPVNRFTNYAILPKIKYHEMPASANDAIKVNNRDLNAKNQQFQYELRKGKARLDFKNLINKKIQERQYANTKNLQFNVTDSKIDALKGLLFAINSHNNIYANNIPIEIRSEKAAIDYCAYFEVEKFVNPHGSFLTDKEYLDKQMAAIRTRDSFAYDMAQQPVIKAIAVGGLGVTGITFLSGIGAFGFSAEMWGSKVALDVVYQTTVNKNIRETNIVSTFGNAFLMPGTSSILSNGLDIRPFSENKKFNIVGYNKKWEQFATESTIGIVFGQANSSSWKYLSGMKPSLNNTERYILYPSTQSWFGFSSYGISKKAISNFDDE